MIKLLCGQTDMHELGHSSLMGTNLSNKCLVQPNAELVFRK